MHAAAAQLWQEVQTSQTPSLHTFALPAQAGETARLHFAGAGLEAAYSPALGHRFLMEAMARPAFEVFLWDAAETGVPLPAPPESLTKLGPHGAISDLPAHQRAIFQGNSGVLTLFDQKESRGYVITADAQRLPNFDLAAPLRFLLSWVGAGHSFTLTHAAAVGTEHGAALLAGRGGSGKSTTSLACALDGFEFLGDDYVGLTEGGTQVVVHSLYRSAKIASSSFTLLPSLRSTVRREPSGVDDDKYLLTAPDFASGGVPLQRPVRAIFLPRVSGEAKSRLQAAPAAAALAALAPSTIFQLSGDGEALLARLAAVVKKVPAFRLELGRGGDAPHLIRRALAECSS